MRMRPGIVTKKCHRPSGIQADLHEKCKPRIMMIMSGASPCPHLFAFSFFDGECSFLTLDLKLKLLRILNLGERCLFATYKQKKLINLKPRLQTQSRCHPSLIPSLKRRPGNETWYHIKDDLVWLLQFAVNLFRKSSLEVGDGFS